jgi:hypothetical protein
LENGKISEGIIHKDELEKCERIYLVNSVREWVQVEI